jgi:HSP20 family protein
MNYLRQYTPKSIGTYRSFDNMLDTFFKDTPYWKTQSPSVDIREEEDKFILEADMAGLSEKDIDVNLDNNLLTISAEKEDKNEEEKEGYVLRERRASSFKRSFVLPDQVDREGIEAAYKNGVLTLEIAKKPEAKPRSISIKGENKKEAKK